MIKVLHFFKTYHPETMGGIEQVIFQLAEGCAEGDVQSEVLYLSARGGARDETVGHHLSHRSKLDFHVASTGFSLSAIKDFKQLADQADLIHYHFPWPYMDLVHFISRVHKPTVVSYHADIVKQKTLLKFYQPLMDRFLGSVDRIVASSPHYVQSSPVLKRFAEKVTVIPYGLDPETYPKPSAEHLEYWRSRVGSKFFLFVGALRYYKGLDYLLEAAVLCGLPIVIVGCGHMEAELKSHAASAGANSVHFVGGVCDEDKAALLTLCHGFVFPSHVRSESFGISLLEAAMYGKPLISCEIASGMSYVNIHRETGLVVPPGDASALASAMQSIWDDAGMARAMGEAAHKRFEQVFTAQNMCKRYVEVYQSVLQSRS